MRPSRLVAIHQPNFFPWLGYFDKLVRSDVFVLLDHVQYPKTGGSWLNRVQLLLGGEPRWVTAPIVRSVHGVRPVAEVAFQPGNPWREKLVRSLAAHYARASHFRPTMALLEPVIMNPEPMLARYNAAAVIAIAEAIGVDTRHVRWSSDLSVSGTSTDMLIDVTRRVGGDSYLCGGGAAGYQDDARFAEAAITLRYQHFQHPAYPQRRDRDFTPGLSVIDALMHTGQEAVGAMLAPAASTPRCQTAA